MTKPNYVYVASSWRNPLQIAVVAALRAAGIAAYDFRNPAPGETGFSWKEILEGWLNWSPAEWRTYLDHPIAQTSYKRDKDAMDRADCCVLVLPAGRSSHLEAGYMAGRNKPVYSLVLQQVEPDLMQLLCGPADNICVSMMELLAKLGVED